MTPASVNGEGILLQVRQAGEGGRSLHLFTRQEGLRSAFVSRSTLRRCGTGVLFPFAHLRYSAVESGELTLLTQYEGQLFFSMMELSYEEITRWYYAVEIACHFFPEGEADGDAYALLAAAARMGKEKNKTVVAFMLSVQLLAAAGYDPAEEEPMESLRLSGGGKMLIRGFRSYRWQGMPSCRITKEAFYDAAGYLDRFLLRYGEWEMKTRGAFLLPQGM